jgi:hypothetical protein
MTLEAISGSATVAIACAIVFFLAAKSWQLFARSLATHLNFPDSIMREAAQRFRDEFEQLSRQQSAYVATLVMFVVVFVVGYTFQASALFIGYPAWQLYLLLLALAGAIAFGIYRLVRVVSAWREIRFLRDANIAVGHSLQRIASNHGRVYHDVVTSAGVVDHVILGPSGVYAINVVARRGPKQGTVKMDADGLRFSNRHGTVSVSDIATKTTRLEQDFRQLLRDSIRLRSVIAVPGWQVEMQNGDGCLVVNERTLPMLRGWKSEADYLMDEDVDALQAYLTTNCRRSSPKRRKSAS